MSRYLFVGIALAGLAVLPGCATFEKWAREPGDELRIDTRVDDRPERAERDRSPRDNVIVPPVAGYEQVAARQS